MTKVETLKANSGEQEAKLCVFCDIHLGKTEAAQIAETDNLSAIISLEGHPIIFPKEHITPENALDKAEVIKEMYAWAFSLVEPIKEALGATGITLITNLGRSAGQEFEHLHVHLIDRAKADRKVQYGQVERPSFLDRQKRAFKITSRLSQP